MRLVIAPQAGAFLVLVFGAKSASGQTEVGQASCNATTYFSLRTTWASENEPCHQKLSFDIWAYMKAEGSDEDADAKHVYVECLRQPEIGLVELITPKDWISDKFSDAPGEIVGETEHAATLSSKGAEDFEVICADEDVAKAVRVRAVLGSKAGPAANARHLQTTTSEAGAVHQVDELIQGLAELGCLRTTGEDQTICVLSDSFDNNGAAAGLQASGDLPDVDVVRELPGFDGSDEGSAMIELAFDIASGSNYKFNTASIGEEAFADDITTLAGAEECDVIVDDISYFAEPSFRDGVIANAVDIATQDYNILYFSSAANSGPGHRFVLNLECQQDLFPETEAPCNAGVGAHVFDPDDMTRARYFFQFTPTSDDPLLLKWDEDEGLARAMDVGIWTFNTMNVIMLEGIAPSDPGSATVQIDLRADQLFFLSIHQTGVEPFAALNMQLVSVGSDLGDFSSGSMFGHACATNALSVAAMDHLSATGDDGEFADPEPALVEDFSARGPCLVGSGQGLITRNHPVTTAADGLQTSTPGFEVFFGTSAAAPVAAGIAAIIRAACFPRVVTFDDMMEMLTDYEFTIDATSDASGAAETFGFEAGYGIISAQQMCLWVAQNCQQACPNEGNAIVHGDPHLVGLAGQKFDFTGQSNSWYALLSAWGTDHVNMRVTAPLADLPVVTYITGVGIQTEDEDGHGHSIAIFVREPSVLDTSCPADGQSCIGDGALTVLLDEEIVVSPGKTDLGPGVSFVAANIPGECRPFGFERYWQQKVREAALRADGSGRRLSSAIPTMGQWIAEDPSATNPKECKEYVSNAVENDGLFDHQSDHVSFQIVTPKLTLRLNHGKLHQLPERDPTDTFSIPDHNTFQMNLGFMDIRRDATMQGIIGETSVPTVDDHGDNIMSGLDAIRGQEEDYKVDGPFGKAFEQLNAVVK